MDGGAWQTIVHGVTKSQTPLSKHVNPYNIYILEKNLKKWIYVYVYLIHFAVEQKLNQLYPNKYKF